MESISQDNLKHITSRVLEIHEYTPPRIEYQGKVFYINTSLFKGNVENWFTEKRWEESFPSEAIKKGRPPDTILSCTFFGTNYELRERDLRTKSIKITPSHEDVGGSPNLLKRCDPKGHVQKEVYILIEERCKDNGADYYVSVKLVDFRFTSIIRFKTPIIESVHNIILRSIIKNLTCSFELIYKTEHKDQHCVYISKKKFYVDGNGGYLKTNVDHPINSLKEAIQEIKTKSVLYKFFSLL